MLPKETVNIVDKQTVLSFALHLADTTIDRMPLFEVIVENITEWICNAATYKESGRKDTFGNGKLISGFTDEFKVHMHACTYISQLIQKNYILYTNVSQST